MNFKLKPVSYAMVRHACIHWHYSQSVPVGKLFSLGVFENDMFKGVIIYSHGANHHIGNEFGLTQFECVELTRIALCTHDTPVSKIIATSLKILKKTSPKLKLVVSYADLDQNHNGIVYQASNWVYLGTVNCGTRSAFIVNGIKKHPKSIHSMGVCQTLHEIKKHLDKNASVFITKGKHKYLYPLCDKIKNKIIVLKKNYPTADEVKEDTSWHHQEECGATPTHPLHL